MYFAPVVTEHEFPALVRRFTEITGWKPWRKRFEWLQAGLGQSVAMPYFWRERFELELTFATSHKRYRLTGKYSTKNITIEQQRLLSFLAVVVRSYERLGQLGKNSLRGMLLDSLKNDDGLAPLAYEMKIVAHLLNQGFDVTYHDLETGGNFDYLAVKDDLKIEIECKFVTGDIGRQIHKRRLYQFGEYVIPKLNSVLTRVSGGIFVQIRIPGRLYGHEKQHSVICKHVLRAIENPGSPLVFEENTVSATTFDLESSPFHRLAPEELRQEHIEGFTSRTFGISNKNMLILFRPGRHALIVALESTKEDKVLTGIHKRLKKSAAKQFSGNLPAMLCCHLADLSEAELLSLQYKGDEGIGLDYMTADLITRRPQLLAVTYTAPGNIAYERMTVGQFEHQSQREVGPTYTLRNPHHSLASDLRYSIF